MPEPLREADMPQSHQDLVAGCILLLLAEQRGHGYELHERINQMMPLREVSAGNLYRELRRMDVREASQTSGPARRVYEITIGPPPEAFPPPPPRLLPTGLGPPACLAGFGL